MSPIQSNTQKGIIVVPAASDLSASIGCFANIGSDGNAALPSSHGFALYVIANAYASGGIITPPSGTATGAAFYCELQPLMGERNVRVIAADGTITAPG